MKTKLLAVVSTGALLLMSGPANAFPEIALKWTLKGYRSISKSEGAFSAVRNLFRVVRRGTDLKVSSLYGEATPQILNALNAPEALTQQQLESIINAAVKKAIESAAKEEGSGITFEALTGKLKVDLSYTTAFAKVIPGEVNVYEISAAVAAGVIACKDQPGFIECAKAALAKAAVAKEMVSESARIPEKTPTILDE